MTIFDSIKYPISNPPTLEQLENIPYHILYEWKINNNFTENATPYSIYGFYKREVEDCTYTDCKWEVDNLRRRIKEYDDNI